MNTIFIPDQETLRIIFLNVGQGESTLIIAPDSSNKKHQYVLIDSNNDIERGGLDLAKTFRNQIPTGELIFINTHPHSDHLRGIDQLHEQLKIREVWHSGHTPHRENKEEYEKMQEVIKKIGKEHEFFLRGSRGMNTIHTNQDEESKTLRKIGDIDYQVFSPAKYICDEIDDETDKERRKRIHSQCAVIRLSYNNRSIMITGDSNKKAWETITPYFDDLLACDILSASHHGSRTFFKDQKEDEVPYTEHLQKLSPKYLVISAPLNSPHDHPHTDALEIYNEYIRAENIYNLGEHEQCLVADIDQYGTLEIYWTDLKYLYEEEKQSTFLEYHPTVPSIIKPYSVL